MDIIQITDSKVAEYIFQAKKLYSKGAVDSIVEDYYVSDFNQDRPREFTLQWNFCADKLELSTNKNFEVDLKTIAVSGTTGRLINLMGDTVYYWRTSLNGTILENGNFKTADTVRWIYADDMRNVRDLGGWNGLKQGLVYRGRELNITATPQKCFLSDAGKVTMKDDLGIKTHLDLREETRYGDITASPLGFDVRWEKCPIWQYSAIFDKKFKEVLRQAFEIFCEKENYPVYVHCVWGADRTGTLAFLLQGLCGVSEEDLYIDYEMTTFSDITKTKDGEFEKMLQSIKKNYAGNTLQKKIENFVILELGLTEIQVMNIQSILASKESKIE